MSRHLLVTNDFPPKVGGIQVYLWELWRRLDPKRFAVLTASSHPDGPAFDAEQAGNGIVIERVDERTLFFPTALAAKRVRQAAAAHDADLVVFDPAVPLGLLGPHLGLPYAVVLHGSEVTAPGRVPGARQALAFVLGHADLIVSAGRYPAAEAQRAARRRRLPPVVVVPPGVDCSQFAPLDPPARAAQRSRLGLPTSGLLAVGVSRLVPRKGMDVLVEAARRLAPSLPDLTVAVAGEGRDGDRLARMVARSSAPVRLLGRIEEPDKQALVAAADVFVMPCRNRWFGLEQEGFGIVFLEAAASGVPQIAGASGGAAEAVVDGVTGLVVDEPEDPGAVALGLRRILTDPELRSQMGREARNRAVACFDYDRLAPRLAHALAQVGG